MCVGRGGGMQVAKHARKDDCWCVIHGQVLDVTSFLGEHPGGEDVILAHAGQDASAAFDAARHPSSVGELLRRYTVAPLAASDASK
mmetsp:Transcript_11616/g.30687  ORF Transcript_11616/g.30687 Transcript_11616/m.30687 type:complete len:86 (-) Transcript_11616:520-777(-)